jgi:hypothetical protein
MADRGFEADLDRAFSETPAFPDADLFALRVTEALDRGWAVRRLLIGALGVAGGLIGGLQFLRSGLLEHMGSVGATWRLLSTDVTRLPVARGLSEMLASGATMDSEVLWMSGALALLAVGLFVTRALRDI